MLHNGPVHFLESTLLVSLSFISLVYYYYFFIISYAYEIMHIYIYSLDYIPSSITISIHALIFPLGPLLYRCTHVTRQVGTAVPVIRLCCVCVSYFSLLMRRLFGDKRAAWRVSMPLGHTEDQGAKKLGRIEFQNAKLLFFLKAMDIKCYI